MVENGEEKDGAKSLINVYCNDLAASFLPSGGSSRSSSSSSSRRTR